MKKTIYLLSLLLSTTFHLQETAAHSSLPANELLQIELIFSVMQPNCVGETGSIEIVDIEGGTPPYSFALDNGAFSDETLFDDLAPGGYELTGKDATDCEVSYTLFIEEANQLLTQININGQLFDLADSVRASALVNTAAEIDYEWYVDDEIVSIQSDATFQIWDSLLLRLEIRDENGCTAFDEIMLYVNEIEDNNNSDNGLIFIPNAFSPNNDGINDVFTIYGRPELVKQIISMQIYNRNGDLVFLQRNYPINEASFGWDGEYRRGQNNRRDSKGFYIYTYLLEIELQDNSIRNIQGDVLLTR